MEPMTDTLPHRIASDNETNDRLRRYERYRKYYDGEHDIVRRSRRHKRPRNLIDLMVDTIVAHLGHATVTWGANDKANTLDEHLQATLAANGAELLDETTEIGASVQGDAAYKVTYDDEQQRVRVATVDPAGLFIETAADDLTDIWHIAHSYELERSALPLVLPNLSTFTSNSRKVRVTESWTAGLWQIWLDNQLASSVPNPYGELPYVVFPNVRVPWERWGRSDVARLIDHQDRYNDSGADLDDMMELAHAVILMSGVDNADDLVVRPGAIWELPPNAKAELLDFLRNGAAAQRLEVLEALRSEMQQAARVPDLALGLKEVANVSGAALNIQLGPLLRLVARKRLSRSEALRRRAQLIARLGAKFQGLPSDTGLTPDVYWTEALPSDRSVELANATAELNLGLSRETALKRVGFDDAGAELDKRRQEDASLGTERQQPEPAAASA